VRLSRAGAVMLLLGGPAAASMASEPPDFRCAGSSNGSAFISPEPFKPQAYLQRQVAGPSAAAPPTGDVPDMKRPAWMAQLRRKDSKSALT
jgi:hypothetical protein